MASDKLYEKVLASWPGTPQELGKCVAEATQDTSDLPDAARKAANKQKAKARSRLRDYEGGARLLRAEDKTS